MRVHPLDRADYLSVTTFRRDGTPVPTPVWFSGTAGRYVLVTAADSAKVKRLALNPRVEVATCDRKGELVPGAAVLAGTARVIEGAAAAAAEREVRRKYRLHWAALEAGAGLWRRLRGTDAPPTVVVEITLTEAI